MDIVIVGSIGRLLGDLYMSISRRPEHTKKSGNSADIGLISPILLDTITMGSPTSLVLLVASAAITMAYVPIGAGNVNL